MEHDVKKYMADGFKLRLRGLATVIVVKLVTGEINVTQAQLKT
jgi:hypothetical protein